MGMKGPRRQSAEVANLEDAMAKWLRTAVAAAITHYGGGGASVAVAAAITHYCGAKGEILELGIWPPSSEEAEAFYSYIHAFAHSPSYAFAY
jgi:hypothetical protein